MAYDASNLTKQLFFAQAGTWTHAVNSNANVVPTVANGKVYVASNRQLQIFGLTTPAAAARATRTAPTPSQPDLVTCAPPQDAVAAVPARAGMHQFYGKVCRANAGEVQLSLRNGHSIVIDVRNAFAAHQRLILTPGRTIRIQATIDDKNAAHAVRISPAHTLSALTPADR